MKRLLSVVVIICLISMCCSWQAQREADDEASQTTKLQAEAAYSALHPEKKP